MAITCRRVRARTSMSRIWEQFLAGKVAGKNCLKIRYTLALATTTPEARVRGHGLGGVPAIAQSQAVPYSVGIHRCDQSRTRVTTLPLAKLAPSRHSYYALTLQTVWSTDEPPLMKKNVCHIHTVISRVPLVSDPLRASVPTPTSTDACTSMSLCSQRV